MDALFLNRSGGHYEQENSVCHRLDGRSCRCSGVCDVVCQGGCCGEYYHFGRQNCLSGQYLPWYLLSRRCFCRPERNMSFSNPVPFVEAGIGGSTFTVTWRDIRNDEPNDEKIAVFTLTVWDPAGRPYSTSLESGQMGSGLMSVSLSSPESGEGQFSLTSTILERKLNISAPAGL